MAATDAKEMHVTDQHWGNNLWGNNLNQYNQGLNQCKQAPPGKLAGQVSVSGQAMWFYPLMRTVYVSHYDRMMTVIAAARTGNEMLIKLALAEHDKWGSSDEASSEAKSTEAK